MRHLAKLAVPLGLVVAGTAIGAVGIYIGETDDAPGAALLGILLMLGALALGVRIGRRRMRRPQSSKGSQTP